MAVHGTAVDIVLHEGETVSLTGAAGGLVRLRRVAPRILARVEKTKEEELLSMSLELGVLSEKLMERTHLTDPDLIA